MKKLLAFSLISVLSFGGLVACSDEPEQFKQNQVASVQQVPVQTQPQVVVVDNGISAGEAMLVGAAAGAIAGNITSSNKHSNSYTTSQPNYNKAYTTKSRTTSLPPVNSLTNSNKLANTKTTSVSTVSSSTKKPISFDLNKPSSSSMTSSSSSKSFKSSGSGFKSSSRRR